VHVRVERVQPSVEALHVEEALETPLVRVRVRVELRAREG